MIEQSAAGRVGTTDELLPHCGPNAGIVVECPHSDADRLGVVGVRAEHCRAAVAAKPLLTAALRRLPHSQLLLTGDDPEAARSRVRLRRCPSAGSPLTSFAMAVARADEWLSDFVPNRATVTTTGEREFHAGGFSAPADIRRGFHKASDSTCQSVAQYRLGRARRWVWMRRSAKRALETDGPENRGPRHGPIW